MINDIGQFRPEHEDDSVIELDKSEKYSGGKITVQRSGKYMKATENSAATSRSKMYANGNVTAYHILLIRLTIKVYLFLCAEVI